MRKKDSNRITMGVSVVLNALAWGLAFIFPREEAAAILHYSSSVGIDFVGEGRHIMVLPAVGTLVMCLNFAVGRAIVKTDPRTATLLTSAVPLVQIVLIIALLFLRSVNT